MLNILDLQDVQMSGEAKVARMMADIEQRFEEPLSRAQLTTLAVIALQKAGKTEEANQIRRMMGGKEDGESIV